MKKISNDYLKPSQKQLNSLLEYYQAGRYVDAEELSLSITQQFPKNQFAWKVLAAALRQNGKINEALVVSQKSIQIDPQDSEAHKNFAVLLHELGRLKEAETSFKQAIKFKPDYAEAYSNLGVLLQMQGRLEEAETNYKKAIKFKPDYPRYHNNLGILLKDLKKLNDACAAFIQAINLDPYFSDAYVNLGITLKNIRFNSSNTKLHPVLIRLISIGNFVRPESLAPSILSLLKYDPEIKNLVFTENSSVSLNDVKSIINRLDKLKLLHHLMRVCPLPDLKFEKFFTNTRSLLLTNLDNIDATSELIYFLSTLSLHCFTNEYIYLEKDKETKLIKKLESEIVETIAKSKQPEAKKILCLASYRPLHKYNWCNKLETLNNLKDVKSRFIEEPFTERSIVAEIPIFNEISDNVSYKVRAQYEENPYPRWVKTGMHTKSKSITEICDEVNLQLHSESIKKVIAPAILIAGCGTGQHSIVTASHFSNCQVTAVDLSLASLAYAKRKTNELGITNIKYLQADILKLDKPKQKFDIVDSVGVLHHMSKPMTGWRILTDLLKPGGMMRIGLYSELARQHIVKIRNEISSFKVGISEAEIRKFRQSLIISKDKHHQQLTKASDFFSLSALRDLIFHVQEHRFNLPQINNCLSELGLKFCGFINKDTISDFKEFHGRYADIYDLELWHRYEKNNPKAFSAMYQFWCQKL